MTKLNKNDIIIIKKKTKERFEGECINNSSLIKTIMNPHKSLESLDAAITEMENTIDKLLIGISKYVCDYCPCSDSKCDGHCKNKTDMDIILEYLRRNENYWLKEDE